MSVIFRLGYLDGFSKDIDVESQEIYKKESTSIPNRTSKCFIKYSKPSKVKNSGITITLSR